MMHGDILSSNCKDCIANSNVIPDCPTCKCQCFTSVFLFKDIQAMAVKKLQLEESKARACIPNVNEHMHINLGKLFATAVHDGISRLQVSNSIIIESNVLSATSGHLSRLQLPCKEHHPAACSLHCETLCYGGRCWEGSECRSKEEGQEAQPEWPQVSVFFQQFWYNFKFYSHFIPFKALLNVAGWR
jgi:hypothetical protein